MTHERLSILPTHQEFLAEVRYFCRRVGWDDPDHPAKVLGAIVEFLLEGGKEPSFYMIVSRFYFIRAEVGVLRKEDPVDWTKKVLSRTRG